MRADVDACNSTRGLHEVVEGKRGCERKEGLWKEGDKEGRLWKEGGEEMLFRKERRIGCGMKEKL